MEKEKRQIIKLFHEAMDSDNYFEAGYVIDKGVLNKHIKIVKEIEREGYIKVEKYRNTNGPICNIIFEGEITDKGIDLMKELKVKKK